MKNVLVSGGSRGIGEAIVRRFALLGYRVAFTYKCSDEKAEMIKNECGAVGFRCDFEKIDEIIDVYKKVVDYFGGGVDILVNNAALSEIKLFCDISNDDWKKMIDVNLTAPFVLSRECVSSMIKKHSGRIINISSMWGECGASCEVHYSAAKAGLIGMTKALAKELGPTQITVNCITPGVIDTDMNSHLSKEDREALIDDTPLMRIGTVDDVACAVTFLASESASFITGQVIGVNGGMVI